MGNGCFAHAWEGPAFLGHSLRIGRKRGVREDGLHGSDAPLLRRAPGACGVTVTDAPFAPASGGSAGKASPRRFSGAQPPRQLGKPGSRRCMREGRVLRLGSLAPCPPLTQCRWLNVDLRRTVPVTLTRAHRASDGRATLLRRGPEGGGRRGLPLPCGSRGRINGPWTSQAGYGRQASRGGGSQSRTGSGDTRGRGACRRRSPSWPAASRSSG